MHIYIYTVGESVGPGLMASEILKSGPESSLCGGLLRVLNNPEKWMSVQREEFYSLQFLS